MKLKKKTKKQLNTLKIRAANTLSIDVRQPTRRAKLTTSEFSFSFSCVRNGHRPLERGPCSQTFFFLFKQTNKKPFYFYFFIS